MRVYENERAVLRVGAELKGKSQAVRRRYRVTTFHLYLVAFRVLLVRYSPVDDWEDVAIDIGDSNRTDNSTTAVIGPFVNFLALRLRTQSTASFTHLSQNVRIQPWLTLERPFRLLNEGVSLSLRRE